MEKNKIVLPDYENSILNLINSILHYYHVETKYNGLDILNKKYKVNVKEHGIIEVDKDESN